MLAFYRSRDHSYKEEMRIFDLLYAYMRPGSLLEPDINKPGGVALELWGLDTTYYPAQVKRQPNNSKIRIKKPVFDRHRPFDRVVSSITLYLATTDPVYLWDPAGTDSVAVTFPFLKFEMGSSPF